MSRKGLAFINAHKRTKGFWADCKGEHQKLSEEVILQTAGGYTEVHHVLHKCCPEYYINNPNNQLELSDQERPISDASKKKLLELQTAELKLRDQTIAMWDIGGSIHAWRAQEQFKEKGLRAFPGEVVQEVLEAIGGVILTLPDEDAKDRNSLEQWKENFMVVSNTPDDTAGRSSSWLFLRATQGDGYIPQLWRDWLFKFRVRNRLRMKLSRTVGMMRLIVENHSVAIGNHMDNGTNETIECRSHCISLRQAVWDLADVGFRLHLRRGTTHPQRMDKYCRVLYEMKNQIGRFHSGAKELLGLFIDDCLTEIRFDRICEGYAWYWIEFLLDLDTVVLTQAWSPLENINTLSFPRLVELVGVFKSMFRALLECKDDQEYSTESHKPRSTEKKKKKKKKECPGVGGEASSQDDRIPPQLELEMSAPMSANERILHAQIECSISRLNGTGSVKEVLSTASNSKKCEPTEILLPVSPRGTVNTLGQDAIGGDRIAGDEEMSSLNNIVLERLKSLAEQSIPVETNLNEVPDNKPGNTGDIQHAAGHQAGSKEGEPSGVVLVQVIGEIHEFEPSIELEAFLNDPE